MALQDVTSAKGVLAQMALVRALSGVSQQMTLEMFQVKIGFVAMRAFVFALRILGSGGRRFAGSGRRPSRVGRKDATTALLTNNMDWLRLVVSEHRRMRIEGRMLQSYALTRRHLVAIRMRGGSGQHGCLRVSRSHGQTK